MLYICNPNLKRGGSSLKKLKIRSEVGKKYFTNNLVSNLKKLPLQSGFETTVSLEREGESSIGLEIKIFSLQVSGRI